jgi:hypothetical protein
MKVIALAAAQMGMLNMLPATAEYVWPSIHDRMEDLLVLQGGYIREGFVDGTYYPLHDVGGYKLICPRCRSLHSQSLP